MNTSAGPRSHLGARTCGLRPAVLAVAVLVVGLTAMTACGSARSSTVGTKSSVGASSLPPAGNMVGPSQVLQPGDVPAGLTGRFSAIAGNDPNLSCRSDSQADADGFQSGEVATYTAGSPTPPQGVAEVVGATLRFAGSGGASAYLAFLRTCLASLPTSSPALPGPVGQEALVTTGPAGQLDGGQIVWRDGTTLGLVTETATTPVDLNALLNLARIQENRTGNGAAVTSTTVTVSPSDTPLFGTSVTLQVTVSDVVTGLGVPTGSITISDGSQTLVTEPLVAGSARYTTSDLAPGGHDISVAYAGDASHWPSSTTAPLYVQVRFSTPCAAQTLTSVVVASGQAVCLGPGTTVNGSVVVDRGGALWTMGATIRGGLIANHARALVVCGAHISGSVTILNTTGSVLFGGDGDGTTSCAGNTVTGAVNVSGNTGGLELSDNTVAGSISVTANRGAGLLPEDAKIEVFGNTAQGRLQCSGNATMATGGTPNQASGAPSGQCSVQPRITAR